MRITWLYFVTFILCTEFHKIPLIPSTSIVASSESNLDDLAVQSTESPFEEILAEVIYNVCTFLEIWDIKNLSIVSKNYSLFLLKYRKFILKLWKTKSYIEMNGRKLIFTGRQIDIFRTKIAIYGKEKTLIQRNFDSFLSYFMRANPVILHIYNLDVLAAFHTLSDVNAETEIKLHLHAANNTDCEIFLNDTLAKVTSLNIFSDDEAILTKIAPNIHLMHNLKTVQIYLNCDSKEAILLLAIIFNAIPAEKLEKVVMNINIPGSLYGILLSSLKKMMVSSYFTKFSVSSQSGTVMFIGDSNFLSKCMRLEYGDVLIIATREE